MPEKERRIVIDEGNMHLLLREREPEESGRAQVSDRLYTILCTVRL